MPPPSYKGPRQLKTMHCMQYATDIKLHVHTYAVGAADIVLSWWRLAPHSSSSQQQCVSLVARRYYYHTRRYYYHVDTSHIVNRHVDIVNRHVDIVNRRMDVVAWQSAHGATNRATVGNRYNIGIGVPYSICVYQARGRIVLILCGWFAYWSRFPR